MTNYKKVPMPRAPALGNANRARDPLLAPLKPRGYAKDTPLGAQDPTKFNNVGFGSTGLQQTPSIIGMGKPGFK